jgi:cytosine/adenosine deaminase-related metal-dependent hydrolase
VETPVSAASLSDARALAAAWVLPVDRPPVRDGVVVVQGGRIAWIGPRPALPAHFRAAPARAYPRALLLPGLVDPHTHLALTAIGRGLPGRAAAFTDWLRAVISEQRGWQPGVPAAAAAAGIRCLLQNGVTTVGDMGREPPIEVFAGQPARAVLFREVIAFPAARAPEAAAAAHAWLDDFPVERPTRLRPGLAPHAPYSVSAPLMTQLAALAREYRAPLAVHLAETRAEQEFLLHGGGPFEALLRDRGAWDDAWRPPGVSPVQLAADTGLLELPGAAVHLNYLAEADIGLLRAGRLVPVWCPGSHRWFGHEAHPAQRLLAAGIPVALATDSLASNTTLDMLAEARLAAAACPAVPPETWLRAVTLTAARAVDLDDVLGSLTPGKVADLIALEPAAGPAADPLQALLAAELRLRLVMIAGEEFPLLGESSGVPTGSMVIGAQNPPWQEGDRVRLSAIGRARAGEMPEAWGLHTAARTGESGEVVEVIPAGPDSALRLSVEFPSGAVYNWPAECFERR